MLRLDKASKLVVVVLIGLCAAGRLSIAQGASSKPAPETVAVLTNTWAPFIQSPGQPPGEAAEVLELILRYANVSIDWQYVPYEWAYYQLSQQQSLLAFPYFKTSARSEKVLYSSPIFTVRSRMYYNRQYLSAEQAQSAYDKRQRIGRVAGYSYGESLDQMIVSAKLYKTEARALTALFNGEIDLLPMTESVMGQLLQSQYPKRQQLIRPLDGISDSATMHLIAAKTPAAEAMIRRVDQAIAYLADAGLSSLQNAPFTPPVAIDVARLVSAEGYPTILGQTETQAGSVSVEYYTLPLGTEVIVLSWSDNMLLPSANDRLYHHMMDLSKVLVLNGPHVGKELYVRNMHIELQ